MIPGVPRPHGGLFAAALLSVVSSLSSPAAVFSNTNLITIIDSLNPPTKASLYPSTITVSGFTNMVVSKVTVTLNGFTHGFPSDVSVLLVGPQGQAAVLMAETGGQDRLSVTNLTLTLDDDAPTALPISNYLTSGTFQPVNAYVAVYGLPALPFNFPAPAPPGNSNSPSALSVFKNTDPNGSWRLFVVDNVSGDAGIISNGWSLNVAAGFSIKMVVNWPNVVLSWPPNATNFQLQAAANPSDSNSWRNIITPPVIVSNLFTVTNPILYQYDFYRLRHY